MSQKETRKASVERKTRETEIRLDLDLDGSGDFDVATGIPFFDHMLESFAKHGLFDLHLRAKGDLEVDFHHTVEDVGIVLGSALREALGPSEVLDTIIRTEREHMVRVMKYLVTGAQMRGLIEDY